LPTRQDLLKVAGFVLLMTAAPALASEGSHAHSHDGVPEKFPEHPAVGEVAPAFTLKDTEGSEIALGEFLGRGYVVLAFGSASSSYFRKSAPELDHLARDWERLEVRVVIIYTREAHPAALRTPVPKSYAERASLARATQKDLRVGLQFLVDGWDDHVHKSYGAMPDGAFLLDSHGTIVAREVQAKASALDQELRRQLKVADPPPSAPSGRAGDKQE